MTESTTKGQESLRQRIAVCSWSLRPRTPEELLHNLLRTGISSTQLALDPLVNYPSVWQQTPEILRRNGIRILSGMFGCSGEDYTSLETIRRTGGIVPDETWPANRTHMVAVAALGRRLGLQLVTFHAGFVPHDAADPAGHKLEKRLIDAANIFNAEGLTLGLETGQETAPILAALLKRLNQSNLGVNFDPANMILYGKGDPVEAVATLAPWIRQVHIKDACHTRVPGTWGEEVPAGRGDVDWTRFFQELEQCHYRGNFVVERESGDHRVEDIRAAVDLIVTKQERSE